jgi:hypothetical protein
MLVDLIPLLALLTNGKRARVHIVYVVLSKEYVAERESTEGNARSV